jgi:hypothetical protein|tara:strand:+ start:303 stop:530 length:228 start_codon:yes stop_codon:yes gene_type:complete
MFPPKMVIASSIEAFIVSILPRTTGIDLGRLDADLLEPSFKGDTMVADHRKAHMFPARFFLRPLHLDDYKIIQNY